MIFPSRRNLVRSVEWNGLPAVRKLFDSPADWHCELEMYRQIDGRLTAPKVLRSAPGILLLEYLPFPTLLAELERQEREGFSPSPWLALRRWLERMHRLTGLLPADVNLRNFLWDGEAIHGIDFEGCRPMHLPDCLSQTAAFILEYAPRDTAVKRQAARILYEGSVDAVRQALLGRRSRRARRSTDASFVLLAGGKSSRMGCDKAALLCTHKLVSCI